MSWTKVWDDVKALAAKAVSEVEQEAAKLLAAGVADISALLAEMEPAVAQVVAEAFAEIEASLSPVATLEALRARLQAKLDEATAATSEGKVGANGALFTILIQNLPSILSALTTIINMFKMTSAQEPGGEPASA